MKNSFFFAEEESKEINKHWRSCREFFSCFSFCFRLDLHNKIALMQASSKKSNRFRNIFILLQGKSIKSRDNFIVECECCYKHWKSHILLRSIIIQLDSKLNNLQKSECDKINSRSVWVFSIPRRNIISVKNRIYDAFNFRRQREASAKCRILFALEWKTLLELQQLESRVRLKARKE